MSVFGEHQESASSGFRDDVCDPVPYLKVADACPLELPVGKPRGKPVRNRCAGFVSFGHEQGASAKQQGHRVDVLGLQNMACEQLRVFREAHVPGIGPAVGVKDEQPLTAGVEKSEGIGAIPTEQVTPWR